MRNKNIFPGIAVAIAVALLVGAYILFNELFPKAKDIRLPEEKDILSISVGINNDETFEIKDVDLSELLRLLGDAKPTREQSLNDYPGSRPFYQVEIQTSERQYRYFIYENGSGQFYIEIPYEGVYNADDAIFNFIVKFFEE